MSDIKKESDLVVSDSEKYLGFISKFKAKKTTDSCFTPANIYDAVKNWTVNEYDLSDSNILRPFIPDGDYQSIEYTDNDVVIDNPPFSIATQIVRFYEANNIKYFIFANQLTLLSSDAHSSIVVGESIEYTNGAKIATSFLTNLDANKIRTAPELLASIKQASKSNKIAKTLPKYRYPDNAVTAASLSKIANVEFKVPRGQATKKISRLDSQKPEGKTFFGGGILISNKKAAELKAAELKAAKKVTDWPLSDREIELIKGLDNND